MPFWIQQHHKVCVLRLLVAIILEYVKEFVKSCDVCAWANNLRHRPHGFLQPLPIFISSWFSISMDFIIDPPPSSSYDSILVVVDHLTNMTNFIPCTKIIIGEGIISCFLIMFFDITVFLKISFLIMGLILHPSI